jgi:hypothetical protein
MKKFFARLLLKWRIHWSNWRFYHEDEPVTREIPYSVGTVRELATVASSIYETFDYKWDGPTELFDAMHAPWQCYQRYVEGGLVDDCDGFHGALYHVSHNSGWPSYLITYIASPLTKSHTMLLIKSKSGRYCIFNYLRHTGWYKTVEEALAEAVSKDTEIVEWNAVVYDYDLGYYREVSKEEI